LERLHGMMSWCLKKREIFSSKSRQFFVINLCTKSVHKNMETFFHTSVSVCDLKYSVGRYNNTHASLREKSSKFVHDRSSYTTK
jgi:hypothetical protein